MVLMSHPGTQQCVAVVCLIVCGLTRFFPTDGIVAATTRA